MHDDPSTSATLGGLTDSDSDGASCWDVTPAGLCNALYTSRAAGSARIFAMRSALVAFGGGGTEAFLRTSLRSATFRALLTPRVRTRKAIFLPKGTHSLDSIVGRVWRGARGRDGESCVTSDVTLRDGDGG